MRAVVGVLSELVVLAAAPGCAAGSGRVAARDAGAVEAPAPPAPSRFEIVCAPEDAALVDELQAVLRKGVADVVDFFGSPFPAPFEVDVLPDRAAFDASFPPEWGMPRTECWMVAAGVADSVRLLSQRVWREEACEHDPDDPVHVRGILTHELVHVFHGQHNPTGDFVGADEVGWFAEGLAVLASGQLETGHLAPAREAVERGLAPRRLTEAWSGRYRYAVAGTLVAYVDSTAGREALFDALQATTQAELLEILGTGEHELLDAWSGWVSSKGP